MIEYASGDCYGMNRKSGEVFPSATVVPFDGSVSPDATIGLMGRFMNWVTMQDDRISMPFSNICCRVLRSDIKFTEAYSVSRLADDGLFSAIIFVCDKRDGFSPTLNDVRVMYERIAEECMKHGIKNITVPLLCQDSTINPERIASTARSVLRQYDIDAVMYLPSQLFAKVVSRTM